MSTIKSIILSEFIGNVVLNFRDKDEEPIPRIYLSPEQAETLSKYLAIAATQIKNGYHYPTTEIE